MSDNFSNEFVKIDKPILIGTESRPGGRIINYENKIIFPIQNNSNGYGTGVSMYEILIDDNDNIEMKIINKMLLKPMEESDLFSHGMHHIDILEINNDYFVVYDGNPNLGGNKIFHFKHFAKYTYLNLLNFFN